MIFVSIFVRVGDAGAIVSGAPEMAALLGSSIDAMVTFLIGFLSHKSILFFLLRPRFSPAGADEVMA